jgi:L-asparaginase II
MSRTPASRIRIEVTRGDLVESVHTGSGIAVDAAGRTVAAWGDPDAAVFGRSAIKPLQALPLVETGAAERWGLSDAELCIACASHNGEPEHARLVQGWLERMGLSVADLECGAHPPYYEPAARTLLLAGTAPDASHNNCSGKHTGMLSHVVHRGEPTRGYIQPDHPAQVRVRAALDAMTGLDLSRAPRGIDGCGLPQYAMSLRAMALGMARFADPARLPAERRAAVLRLRAAIVADPFYLAGTGRFCTDLIRATGGKVLIKTGAEGVYAAILPEQGLGVTLKFDDGGARPRPVAFGAILRHLGALDDIAWSALQAHVAPVLRNHAGTEVGAVRVGPGWLDA